MNRFIAAIMAFAISSITHAGEASKTINEVKNSAMNQAFSYGDSAIESWARDNLRLNSNGRKVQ